MSAIDTFIFFLFLFATYPFSTISSNLESSVSVRFGRKLAAIDSSSTILAESSVSNEFRYPSVWIRFHNLFTPPFLFTPAHIGLNGGKGSCGSRRLRSASAQSAPSRSRRARGGTGRRWKTGGQRQERMRRANSILGWC